MSQTTRRDFFQALSKKTSEKIILISSRKKKIILYSSFFSYKDQELMGLFHGFLRFLNRELWAILQNQSKKVANSISFNIADS